MSYDILAVTFEIDAQRYADGRFTAPVEVCGMLGLKPRDSIFLIIETLSGRPLYAGVKALASGTKI